MGKDRIQQLRWVWSSMKQRCNNPNNSAYSNYGARGIKICQEWESFDQFMEDMGIPPKKWTLDRVDNDGEYSVKNCVWSLRIAQTKNRRNTKTYEIDGKLYTLKEYSRLKNLNYSSLKTRIQKGMGIQEAIFEGKYPNNNIYGKDPSGKFVKKSFCNNILQYHEPKK